MVNVFFCFDMFAGMGGCPLLVLGAVQNDILSPSYHDILFFEEPPPTPQKMRKNISNMKKVNLRMKNIKIIKKSLTP